MKKRLNWPEKQRELADYEAETIKVIRGQSKLSIDLLNDLVAKAKEEIVSLTAALTDVQEELEKCLAGAEAQKQEYAQLETWADIYARCTFEARKMIVSQFVKSVYVYKVSVRPSRISMLLRLQKKTDLLKSKYALASLFSGGPKGDRTLDLQIANLALSQLSYGPIGVKNSTVIF